VGLVELLVGPSSGPGSFLARAILGWPASQLAFRQIEGLEFVEDRLTRTDAANGFAKSFPFPAGPALEGAALWWLAR
jgi:hypothetical protein